MRRSMLISTALLAIILLPLSGLSTAEDMGEMQAGEGFAYGYVISVSSGNIVIREYDYENDQDVEVTYAVNTETRFENVESYLDLENGDDVEVSYKEFSGQRVATMIIKELQWQDEDSFNFENSQGQEILEATHHRVRG